MTWSKKIITARERLGFSQLEVSEKTGISIHEICDIEQHEKEIYTTTDIEDIKKLLSLLELDFMSFFNIDCVFCSGDDSLYEINFGDLVERKMVEKCMNSKDLAEILGFEETVIDKIKHDKSYLNKWSFELVCDCSKALGIPVQVLLNLKCKKCRK